jgi:hypothetical protein
MANRSNIHAKTPSIVTPNWVEYHNFHTEFNGNQSLDSEAIGKWRPPPPMILHFLVQRDKDKNSLGMREQKSQWLQLCETEVRFLLQQWKRKNPFQYESSRTRNVDPKPEHGQASVHIGSPFSGGQSSTSNDRFLIILCRCIHSYFRSLSHTKAIKFLQAAVLHTWALSPHSL